VRENSSPVNVQCIPLITETCADEGIDLAIEALSKRDAAKGILALEQAQKFGTRLARAAPQRSANRIAPLHCVGSAYNRRSSGGSVFGASGNSCRIRLDLLPV
jgi:hypothetical protein